MKPPSPINKPAPVARVGPNWKLIRNLFIIAGLLIAISIAWDLRHQARTKRERENSQILAKQAAAREKALAEAREKAEAERRKREAELAASIKRADPVIPPEPRPPVEIPSDSSGNSTTKKPFKIIPEIVEPDLPPEIVDLNTKARDLVAAAGRKRDEQLAANAKKLSWDLDLHLRYVAEVRTELLAASRQWHQELRPKQPRAEIHFHGQRHRHVEKNGGTHRIRRQQTEADRSGVSCRIRQDPERLPAQGQRGGGTSRKRRTKAARRLAEQD